MRRQGRTQRLADLTSLRRMELAAFSCSRVWASKVFNCLTVELCLRCHKSREDDSGAALCDRHQPVPLSFIVGHFAVESYRTTAPCTSGALERNGH